jgi:predicted nucleic acid-binding protein
VTKVEVLAGMRSSEEWETRRLLNSLEWIDVDNAIADLAGLMANRYLRSYPGIDALDFIIAATAEHLGAALWTRNVKHFPMFANLTRPY